LIQGNYFFFCNLFAYKKYGFCLVQFSKKFSNAETQNVVKEPEYWLV